MCCEPQIVVRRKVDAVRWTALAKQSVALEFGEVPPEALLKRLHEVLLPASRTADDRHPNPGSAWSVVFRPGTPNLLPPGSTRLVPLLTTTTFQRSAAPSI